MARLNISIEIDTEDEETAKSLSKDILSNFTKNLDYLQDKVQVSLTREKDRSGGNLLLPRLEGRVGNHLQSRKAKLKEVMA